LVENDNVLCSLDTFTYFRTMTAADVNFSSSLSRSMLESQTRFAITGDNVRELNNIIKNSKIQQPKKMAKLKKQNSIMTPAVQVNIFVMNSVLSI